MGIGHAEAEGLTLWEYQAYLSEHNARQAGIQDDVSDEDFEDFEARIQELREMGVMRAVVGPVEER